MTGGTTPVQAEDVDETETTHDGRPTARATRIALDLGDKKARPRAIAVAEA